MESGIQKGGSMAPKKIEFPFDKSFPPGLIQVVLLLLELLVLVLLVLLLLLLLLLLPLLLPPHLQ